ncbi:MAG: DegT/DnrJ/EryC1/StrS family aminotransferase [Candidatus Marinimicrobia bacterium]|nr:DegT/DnrJ/EryC1/StrS family aminotransferase [Candidatus Neomarinimicrobiota bacterium]
MQAIGETVKGSSGAKVRGAPMPGRHLFGVEEREAVLRLLDEAIEKGSHILGYNGPEEEAYCQEFAAFLGGGYADGVNSGTNAVYVALRALELEPYGEVIVPPISDPGGIMPVPLCNLIPVPADSAPGSFNTSAEQIAERLTPRTRAILVAHISGIPVDMDPIMELAAKHNLPVIEDCAQAHGALYKGRKVGTLGDIAAFSTMFGKHHATGGQGGVVFTKDERLYWKVRQHADRGKPFGVTLTGGAGAGVGAAASAGGNLLAALNCNMDELHACIGRVQLKKLPEFIRLRRAFAQRVAEGCRALKGIRLVGDPPGCEGVYWFLFFQFDPEMYTVDKAEFVAALTEQGLPFAPSYLFIPTRQPWAVARHVFGDGSAGLPWSAADATHIAPPLPNAEAADALHFRICIHEGWGAQEADDLIEALERVERKFLRGV